MSFVSKIRHILRTEGPTSVMDRSVRYVGYRVKRALVDKQPTVEDWKQLEGRYDGRRAFLLGNGPSLNETPLYLLKDEATMCFNRFDLMLERLPWVPTFYTVVDDRVLLDTIETVNFMSSVSEHSFFPDIHPYNVDFRDRIEKRSNVHWLFLDRMSFSDELPYCGINKTVANVGIQILAYLGFSEIYLLGVDMTYSLPKSAVLENARDITATEDDDESHFDPRYFGKGRKFHVPMLDETFLKFREAREFFGARGVHIANATVGGKLEEFSRTSLTEVLGPTESQELSAFHGLVASKIKGEEVPVEDLLSTSPRIDRMSDVDPSWDYFVAPVDRVHQLVLQYIFEFVPLGPYSGVHLYVNRRKLRSIGPEER